MAVALNWSMRRAVSWEAGRLTEHHNEQGPPRTSLEVARQTHRDRFFSWELRWHLGQPLEGPGEEIPQGQEGGRE